MRGVSSRNLPSADLETAVSPRNPDASLMENGYFSLIPRSGCWECSQLLRCCFWMLSPDKISECVCVHVSTYTRVHTHVHAQDPAPPVPRISPRYSPCLLPAQMRIQLPQYPSHRWPCPWLLWELLYAHRGVTVPCPELTVGLQHFIPKSPTCAVARVRRFPLCCEHEVPLRAIHAHLSSSAQLLISPSV